MSNRESGPLYLRRINPAENMKRFYTLSIQPTLFGGASLVRSGVGLARADNPWWKLSTRRRRLTRR
jgi:hypothetical protein